MTVRPFIIPSSVNIFSPSGFYNRQINKHTLPHLSNVNSSYSELTGGELRTNLWVQLESAQQGLTRLHASYVKDNGSEFITD